jgi:hypothetical protein
VEQNPQFTDDDLMEILKKAFPSQAKPSASEVLGKKVSINQPNKQKEGKGQPVRRAPISFDEL